MDYFAEIIAMIKEEDNYIQKVQYVEHMIDFFKLPLFVLSISREEKKVVTEFIYGELDRLYNEISSQKIYKKKREILMYVGQLLRLLPKCYLIPGFTSKEKTELVKRMNILIEDTMYIEYAIDEMFEVGTAHQTDLTRLFTLLKPIKEEYHKGRFYTSFIEHYKKFPEMSEEAACMVSEYLLSEIERYLAGKLDEDIINNLKGAADLAKFFMNERLLELMYKLLELENKVITDKAVDTLLLSRNPVPQEAINVLAYDLLYAQSLHLVLKTVGKTELFPAEISNKEYLAKSRMVQWLSLPAVLNKVPDEIEYIGSTEKLDVYYIFRYKSDSDNLTEEHKNEWLIGWTSFEGNTLTRFDLYDEVVQEKTEQTLKYIKKNML